MIPTQLQTLVENQPGTIHRVRRDAVAAALFNLGVPLDSEFAEFFFTYTITFFRSAVSDEELCDIAEPTAEITVGTTFVHEVWKLPERFVCLTSGQGEGGYLYETTTGQVWDFDLASRSDFIAGKQRPKWQSFFEFMTWYLAEP
jgi:hypothetical protein